MSNINTLYSLALNYAEEIYFIGLTNLESKSVNVSSSKFGIKSYSNERINEFDNGLRDYCEIKGLNYIKLFGSLSKGDFTDGIHPNSKGHKKIFEIVKNRL